MNGSIGVLNDNVLGGWVINGFNSPPIKVQLLINDEVMETRVANEFRKDLVDKKIHATGKCGFVFFLGKYKLESGDKIDVETVIRLPKGPAVPKVFSTVPSINLKTQNPYFFIHIPKTAGSSMRNMLYNQFVADYIFPNLQDIKANGNRYPAFKELCEQLEFRKKPILLFNGHYTFGHGEKIFGNFNGFTFFRDPVKRTISLLYQFQRMKEKYKKASIEDIFDNEKGQTYNAQTYFMSGKLRPSDLKKADVSVAKKNIDKLAFFGITEKFGESIKRLEKDFGWKLGKTIKTNVNPKKSNKVSKKLMEKIEANNEFDKELYAYALKKFNAKK